MAAPVVFSIWIETAFVAIWKVELWAFHPMVILPPVILPQTKVTSPHNRSHFAPYKSHLTLHTETNDVTADLKKNKKHPHKGLWASCLVIN